MTTLLIVQSGAKRRRKEGDDEAPSEAEDGESSVTESATKVDVDDGPAKAEDTPTANDDEPNGDENGSENAEEYREELSIRDREGNTRL